MTSSHRRHARLGAAGRFGVAVTVAVTVALVAAPPVAAHGDPPVAAFQAVLHARSLYPGPIDGLLGPATARGVRIFQRHHNLAVDGIPGPRTRAALGRYGRHELGERMLRKGLSGWDVAELQFLLVHCGWGDGQVDGSFGPRTERAVRRLQQRASLQVDGVAGPATVATVRRSAGACSSERPKRVIAARVTIGGQAVGGLTPANARAALRTRFERSLELFYGTRRWVEAPDRLARAHIRQAVRRAAAARPGAAVALRVTVRWPQVANHVRHVAHAFFRPPVSARAVLRDLRPVVIPGRDGLRVRRNALARALARRLRSGERSAVVVPVAKVTPVVGAGDLDAVVVVRRDSHRLVLYRDGVRRRVFRVATGRPHSPTPLGRFRIVWMGRNPWWYPPDEPWAAGLDPIPPGPGNPLGTRWMGLSVPGVGIHGAPDPASVGYSVSHGCIRMVISEAEWLFRRVHVGTPVFVVRS